MQILGERVNGQMSKRKFVVEKTEKISVKKKSGYQERKTERERKSAKDVGMIEDENTNKYK